MNKLVQVFKQCCSTSDVDEIEEVKNANAEVEEDVSPNQEIEKQEESTFISDKIPEPDVSKTVKKNKKSEKVDKQDSQDKPDRKRKSRKSEKKIESVLIQENPKTPTTTQPVKLPPKPLKGILKKPKKFF